MIVVGGISSAADDGLISSVVARSGGRRRQVAELVKNLAGEDDNGPPADVLEDRSGRAVLMHGGAVADGRG